MLLSEWANPHIGTRLRLRQRGERLRRDQRELHRTVRCASSRPPVQRPWMTSSRRCSTSGMAGKFAGEDIYTEPGRLDGVERSPGDVARALEKSRAAVPDERYSGVDPGA